MPPPGAASGCVPHVTAAPATGAPEDNFQPATTERQQKRLQKRTANRAAPTPSPEVVAALAGVRDVRDARQPSVVPKEKPPPGILLKGHSNYLLVVEVMDALAITPLRTQSSTSGIWLNLSSVAEYRKLTEGMDLKHIDYASIGLPEDRDLHTVLRGVGPELTEKQVEEFLVGLGYQVTYIRRMRTSRDTGNEPLPLICVNIRRTANSESIFRVKKVRGVDVSFSAKKKDKMAIQCRRCQKFGHSAQFCSRPWSCSHCTRPHHYKDCTARAQPARCANCDGGHSAAYRKCPSWPPAPGAEAEPTPPQPTLPPPPPPGAFPQLRGMQPQPQQSRQPTWVVRQPPAPVVPLPPPDMAQQLFALLSPLTAFLAQFQSGLTTAPASMSIPAPVQTNNG
jgi:hypothetical protein